MPIFGARFCAAFVLLVVSLGVDADRASATARPRVGLGYEGKWIHHPQRVNQALQGKFRDVRPVTIHFVPSLLCTHRCFFCTYGSVKPDKPSVSAGAPAQTRDLPVAQARKTQRLMPLPQIKTALRRLARGGVESILFTGGGEPTTHRNLVQAMAYAKALGLKIALYSNGGKSLTPQVADGVLPLEPQFFRISLNAGSREVQRLVAGVDDYDVVWGNLKEICQAKRRHNSRTQIGLGFVTNVVNFTDLPRMAEELRALTEASDAPLHGLIESIHIRPTVNYAGSRYARVPAAEIDALLRQRFQGSERKKAGDDFRRYLAGEQTSPWVTERTIATIENDLIPRLSRTGIRVVYPKQRYAELLTGKTAPRPYRECRGCVWNGMIWTDGSFYPCVEWGGSPDLELGNILDQRLDEILRSKKRHAVLDRLTTDDLLQRCPPTCPQNHLNIELDTVARAIAGGQADRVRQEMAARRNAAPPTFPDFL